MVRVIRWLAVAGLVAVALSAWMYHAFLVDLSLQEAFAAQEILHISALLSFAAGLLTLTLTIPRRQRPWSAALLVSLILNSFWPFAGFNDWWFVLIPSLTTLTATLVSVPLVVQFLVAALGPATPALLALGYTIRAAGRAPATPAPQAPQTFEDGSLDITVEPMGSGTQSPWSVGEWRP